MDGNPGNLRWFYILEDIFEAEGDERVQSKIKSCQESLSKYPLVIHDPDHCLLLRHFDTDILTRMKERVRLEGSFLGSELSPIKRESPPDQIDQLARKFEEEEEQSRREQEENDLKLAMKLSQEYDHFEPVAPLVQGELFPKPSAAFELSLTTDNVNIDEEELDDKLPKKTHSKQVHELSMRSSDEEIENKPPPPKKLNSIFSQDPVLNRGLESSSDEDMRVKITQKKVTKCPKKVISESSAKAAIFSQDPIFSKFNDDSSDSEPEKPAKGRKKKSATKEPKKKASYCPKPQSGGYAILIALLKEESNPDYKGFMTKNELCHAAQPYASESMTHTKPGASQFYNGWSASSILAKKELIEMWSNPKKIRLTEAGRNLAKAINDKREQASEMLSQNSSQGLSATFDNASWLDDVESQPSTSSSSPQVFQYCYVTVSKEDTTDQMDAELDVSDAVYHLIKCRKSDLIKSGKRYNIKEEKEKFVLAFLHEDDCDEKSPCSRGSEFLEKTSPNLARPKKESQSKPSSLSVSVPPSFCLDFFPSNYSRTPRNAGVDKKSFTEQSCKLKLHPGQYDIILIVDMMEVTGGSSGGKKSRKNITVEELQTLGITYETRKLSIGDFIWIARGSDNCELVLPYIVERKRMDDLRSSIMDGRYKEQKQRIQQCGLPNKIYLVEEIGHYKDVSSRPLNQQGFSKALDRNALDQAMSNTLVRDGFHVKVTNSQKDSMKFLATMTTALKNKYSRDTLYLSSLKGVGNDTHLLAFKDFYEHSRPDKSLTVREVFCNMLICQKGLSAGAAWAITEKYPTFRSLQTAYGECVTNEAREKLISGIPYDNGKKKISLSVSRTLSWLFNERDLH